MAGRTRPILQSWWLKRFSVRLFQPHAFLRYGKRAVWNTHSAKFAKSFFFLSPPCSVWPWTPPFVLLQTQLFLWLNKGSRAPPATLVLFKHVYTSDIGSNSAQRRGCPPFTRKGISICMEIKRPTVRVPWLFFPSSFVSLTSECSMYLCLKWTDIFLTVYRCAAMFLLELKKNLLVPPRAMCWTSAVVASHSAGFLHCIACVVLH